MLFHYASCQDRLQCLRSKNEQIWWILRLSSSFLHLRIAMPHSNLKIQSCSPPFKSFEHVTIQGSKGGYVQDFDSTILPAVRHVHAEYWQDGCFCLTRRSW